MHKIYLFWALLKLNRPYPHMILVTPKVLKLHFAITYIRPVLFKPGVPKFWTENAFRFDIELNAIIRLFSMLALLVRNMFINEYTHNVLSINVYTMYKLRNEI